MNVFVTGVNGQLGHDVINELVSRGYPCIGSDITSSYAGLSDNTAVTKANYVALDITNEKQVAEVLSTIMPNVVIHCAAFTKVDLAEDEPALCWAINVDGTRNIAKVCRDLGAKMVYISTDYVFPGNGEMPYEVNDSFCPQNVYGATKLAGELAVKSLLEQFYIVRTAWVFGINGNNFIKTMLAVGKTHDTVRVVDDQIGTPTYTLDLARLLCDMIETDKYGTYHATNEGGYISWYDFACEIYKQAGLTMNVIPVTTAEYGLSKAKRPLNSRLSKSHLLSVGFASLPDWKDALKRYIESSAVLQELFEKQIY